MSRLVAARRRLIAGGALVLVVILGGLWLLPGSGRPAARLRPPAPPTEAARPPAADLRPALRMSEEVLRRYAMGLTFYDARRLPDAIHEWQAALRSDPGHIPSQLRLAQAREELGALAERYARQAAEHAKYLRYEKALEAWQLATWLIADPADPRHRAARQEIERVRQAMGR